MNKVFLMGRLTADPEVKYSKDNTDLAIARYTLAVNRLHVKEDAKVKADFIRCVAFGKAGEFAGKYFRKGQRVLIEGRIQLGNYTDKDGNKVYTTDIVVEQQEFADAKKDDVSAAVDPMDGFLDISQDDDELPFE